MFKNMIVYRIAPQWQVELTQVEEALAKAPFLECGATQEKSLGWVPPRGPSCCNFTQPPHYHTGGLHGPRTLALNR